MDKKILVVDDEKFFVDPIKLFLQNNGCKVVVAYDGMSGLIKARTEGPDLIMLDLMLSGFSGYQICSLLKFDVKYKDIPIIIVSARDSDKDREMGRNCGADLYVTKPVDLELLIENINKLTE
ncbi:MAG: response regulator [Candidatus Neomarinimicrobiota bacterium]